MSAPVFHFRLQTLLDKRLEAQKQAEEALVKQEKLLVNERKTMTELTDEAERAFQLHERKRLERFATGKHEGVKLVNQSHFLLGLKQDMQAARAAVLAQQIFVDQATDAVRMAKSALQECRREVDVLEKYRQKLETRFHQEIEHAEELEQDEIGNVMYLSGRSRS